MDRSYESLRAEVLQLDRDSQRRIADEIEDNLAGFEVPDEVYAEAARRLEAHRRGEGTALTEEEFFARGKSLIEKAKQGKR